MTNPPEGYGRFLCPYVHWRHYTPPDITSSIVMIEYKADLNFPYLVHVHVIVESDLVLELNQFLNSRYVFSVTICLGSVLKMYCIIF